MRARLETESLEVPGVVLESENEEERLMLERLFKGADPVMIDRVRDPSLPYTDLIICPRL